MLKQNIYKHLEYIYNSDIAEKYSDKLIDIIEQKKCPIAAHSEKWNEQDTILITYGDSIVSDNKVPIATLHDFLNSRLKDTISTVHILPCFPYSSDDGFSVIDYYKVNPELGDWSDIENLEHDYKSMYDFVINHISQHSEWFQKYKDGQAPYSDFFIEADPSEDLSQVVRPRSLPLLTKIETANGTKHVWTTFSDDQIDLNFEAPECMFEMMKVLIEYISKGATIIRLDAIAFLWKEKGTNCLHLPQTHEMVKLMRDIAEAINPQAIILTETNVPNKENLSYFGDNDEAHMVYQFSLPPLLLHSLHTGSSSYLTQWAQSLPELAEDCTFFNFTASHDGIGVRPLEGLLSKEEINSLAEAMKNFGGHISTKRNSDGTDSPYEMNITYFDSLKGTKAGEDKQQVERFICSQTIMMAMKGIPAFYIHSLTATPNYYNGVKETGRARSINRMKWQTDELSQKLESETPNKKVFDELNRIIQLRKQQPAFHPNARQETIHINNNVFAFIRETDSQIITSISNITDHSVTIDTCKAKQPEEYTDIITGEKHKCPTLVLKPYQTVWLR